MVSDQTRENLKSLKHTSGKVASAGLKAAEKTSYAVSHASVFPLRGIFYFSRRSDLWKPVIGRLLLGLISSSLIVGAMFVLTYLPQTAFLAFFLGPLSFLAAVPCVLVESYLIILILSKVFFLNASQDDLFDKILIEQGCEDLVTNGRELKKGRKGLGKKLTSTWHKFTDPKAIIKYLLTFPLNFVPIVGQVAFFALNGVSNGAAAQSRYFQLKGWSEKEREDYIHAHRADYLTFGSIALALNTIPFVSTFFQMTNTAGAALWAADLEKKKSQAE